MINYKMEFCKFDGFYDRVLYKIIIKKFEGVRRELIL